MRVPHTELNPDTLRSLVESFVSREGTDYGERERTMESKVQDVLRLLDLGQAFVTYDEATDSCSIIEKNARLQVPPAFPATSQASPGGARYEKNEQRSYDERSQETGKAEDVSQDVPDWS